MNTTPESPAAPPPDASAPAGLAEGQKLAGVFVLRREVKSGEGEHVWLAHDEILGKDISLHFVPDALRQDDRAMSELRAEIKRNRQLIHPGVLRVYDLIEEAEWAAISMDWFEGESLAALLEKKPGGFALAELEPWVRRACRTLDDVHKIQVVHRNLTPANIFADASGRVLIASFGVSRVIQDALGRLRKKAGGADPGIAYLSPQQLDGEAPTRLDDIYSLGATLFQLLTGQLPFTGEDVFTQIRRAAAPSVSERRHKAGQPGVPPAWEKTVAACLAKAPTDRPQSAGAVAQQLDLSERGAGAGAVVSGAAVGAIAAGAAVVAKEREKEKAPPVAVPVVLPPPVEKAPETAPAATSEPATPKEAAIDRVTPPPVEPGHRLQREGGDDDEEDASGVSEIYPELYPRRSTSPATIAAFVVVAIGILCALIYFSRRPSTNPQTQPATVSTATHEEPHAAGPKATPAPTTAAEPPSETAANSTNKNPGLLPDEPRLVDDTLPAKSDPPMLAEVRNPKTTGAGSSRESASPAPKSGSTAGNPTPASKSGSAAGNAAPASTNLPKANNPPVIAEPLPPGLANAPSSEVAAKLAAAQKAIADAEAAHQDAQKKQQIAAAALVQAQKGVDDKAKAIEPLLKAADELQGERQKRTDQAQLAEDAARDARKAADEAARNADLKARQAEDAKKAFTDWENANKEKLAGRDKADGELQALKAALAEKQKDADAAAQAAADAETRRQQQVANVQQLNDLIAQAKTREMAAEQRKAEEAKRAQREQLQADIQKMQETLKKQMEELERMNAGGTPTPAVVPTANPAPPAVKATPAPATPAPKASAPTPAPARANPTPVAVTPPVATPGPAIAAPPVAPSMLASNSTLPAAAMTPARDATPAASGDDDGKVVFTNSLGLKFVPVGDVQFSIWPTRLQDFEIFAQEANVKTNGWRTPGFKQGPTHPVVNVSWIDAMAFCKWLTDREHKKGVLPKDQIYRLPSDIEWSRGVGLSDEAGKTPADRDMGVPDVFPWGTQWPPPPNAGNYTGEETGSDVAIKGYDDGFAWTSPVGSFPANKYGLYDMGGNVWQWCMDAWTPDSKARVLRGASWYNGALKLSLLSSCRLHANPDSSTDNYGFRIVKAAAEGRSTARR